LNADGSASDKLLTSIELEYLSEIFALAIDDSATAVRDDLDPAKVPVHCAPEPSELLCPIDIPKTVCKIVDNRQSTK
jgi:hypothetical protein